MINRVIFFFLQNCFKFLQLTRLLSNMCKVHHNANWTTFVPILQVIGANLFSRHFCRFRHSGNPMFHFCYASMVKNSPINKREISWLDRCWDWSHFISPLSVLAILFAQEEDREKICFPSGHSCYLWFSLKTISKQHVAPRKL